MSRILVDSSIWIEFFRRPDAAPSLVLDRLLTHRVVCTTGLVKAEVVSGAQSPRDFRRLRSLFDALPLAPERDGFWTHLTRFRYRLQVRGIFGVSIPDLMIATVAIQNRKLVYTSDTDFVRMAPHVPVRLFTP